MSRRRAKSRPARSEGAVLVGIDFSPASEAALERAVDLARRLGVRLELVHVVPRVAPSIPFSAATRRLAAELQAEVEARAGAQLEQQLRRAGRVPAEAKVLVGVPHEEIVAQARRTRAGWIVLAQRGQNLAERLLLGSTADRVARKAEVPVVLVPVPRARGRRPRR